ncbi:MAG: glutathione S-transferase family protein [Gammaproteobacteria bacterium]|nr:glutathione S-transferase family protein [Gammaproteobacteria bacterium]
MIKLYHAPRACSLAALSLLHHLDAPFQLELMDLRRNEHRQSGFLALNPLGQVPVLVDGDFVLTQLGAILGHIARLHGAGRLPELNAREQAEQERWMYFFASVLHIQFAGYWRPERFSDDVLGHEAIRATARKHLAQAFAERNAAMGRKTWLLGDKLCLADFYFLPVLGWLPRVLPEGFAPYPTLEAYLDRLLALPAVQRALADGGVDRQSLLAA